MFMHVYVCMYVGVYDWKQSCKKVCIGLLESNIFRNERVPKQQPLVAAELASICMAKPKKKKI